MLQQAKKTFAIPYIISHDKINIFVLHVLTHSVHCLVAGAVVSYINYYIFISLA